jgi:SAM-dependent methyltransferase
MIQNSPIFKYLNTPSWARRVMANSIRTLVSYITFISDFYRFKRLSDHSQQRFSLSFKDRLPCLSDKEPTTTFDRHYVYHTAWAARVVAGLKPDFHTDISSMLYFSSLMSAFIPVKFYDYRPANLKLSNLSSEPVDLLKLPFADASLQSISCMHVIEHVGLGRYGDQLDPNADLQAISELKRVLAVRGSLLIVVPIGKAKIMFNAHRIYSYEAIIKQFADLTLKEFTLIPDSSDDGDLVINATKELADKQRYGCGCFWFQKPS